jgi:cytochrome P450
MQWSPFFPKVIEDPSVGHQYLLSECPVHHCEAFNPPFFTISRYADVQQELRDTKTFSSHFGQGPRFIEPLGMLCDAPQHTEMRSLVQQAFTPSAIKDLRPTITKLTHKLIDEIIVGDESFELHDDFAFPLPVLIIAGMLGVPEADLDLFKRWSDIQVTAMGSEDPSQFAEDQRAFSQYLTNFLDTRRTDIKAHRSVPDDLLTLIADARLASGAFIEEADALSILSQLLVGGNETTTSLITNLVWRLLEHPAEWAAIQEDRSLIENAVEESLRFDPPVLGLYRNTTCEVTLHNTKIPTNTKVWINYAAANRDASVFTDPDKFMIQRPKQRHMAFGLGVHFCLGAVMARMEAAIALEALLQRFPTLTLSGPGERIAPFFLWGRKSLHLTHTQLDRLKTQIECQGTEHNAGLVKKVVI